MPEVLLIDDNTIHLRIRETLLRDCGISVAQASSSEEALAFLCSLPGEVRLVVTDHVMPGASGSVFVTQLRRLRPRVPVLVISGMAGVEDEYRGLNVIFLPKPCPPESLIRQVQICLQLHG